jgi:general secretion pathway protein B
MSFILDALKKSEHERQRQSNPGLVESGVARAKPRLPMWAIALCILLGINLIVLVVVLTRGALTPQGPLAATQGRPTHSRSAPDGSPPTADQHFSPRDAPPVYAPEIPVPSVAAPAPARPPSAASITDNSAVHVAKRRDPVLNDEDYRASDEEVLPSINELNLTGKQALPELHLDVHVFATKSTERFVFINMRKYHEGATLQEGPTIERIRRDGVILSYQGLRFLLPRQ